MIVDRDFSPCIVFSFSKKDCEAFALHMSKLDLNDDEEKDLVEEVFNNAMNSLSDDDKQLPQVEHMLPLLKRGVGIHHGGLLPLVKEVIEILFQEGLVKVLFATETFAMGLNMPARTVVYTASRKFDGESLRYISSGEYIQMSGRAGRRGIDDKGIAISMVADDYDEKDLRKMLGAKPDALNSSFHLSYYMILNLLRVEEITPEYIMERSYFQYQSRKKIPQLEQQRDQLKRDLQLIKVDNESQVSSYYHVRRRLDELSAELRRIINLPAHSIPFLQPGRLVHMRDANYDYGWGTLLDYSKKRNLKGDIDVHTAEDYTLEVLCWCEKSSNSATAAISFVPSKDPKNGEAQIVSLPLSCVVALSTVRVHLLKNLVSQDARDKQHERTTATIQQLKDQRVPVLDPIENMNIKDAHLEEIISDVQSFESRLLANPMYNHPQIATLYSKYQDKVDIQNQILQFEKDIKEAGQVIMMTELKQMKRVLKRLGYVDSDHVIQTKGRVACEVSTADTLVLTELFFNGTFNSMEPAVIAALLSCMVYTDSPENNSKVKLAEELELPFQQLQEAAKKVAETSVECGIELSVEDYVGQFSPVLMEVTNMWCKGSKFFEICKVTEVYEGSIVRAMRRLEELIRQLCVAAKSIGEELLEKRFLETIEALKKDIVFASSLYL